MFQKNKKKSCSFLDKKSITNQKQKAEQFDE